MSGQDCDEASSHAPIRSLLTEAVDQEGCRERIDRSFRGHLSQRYNGSDPFLAYPQEYYRSGIKRRTALWRRMILRIPRESGDYAAVWRGISSELSDAIPHRIRFSKDGCTLILPQADYASAPMVEFVLGNGHHDDAVEPQQSLFSWAEFMAEPVKPKRRNGKRDGRRGTLAGAQER